MHTVVLEKPSFWKLIEFTGHFNVFELEHVCVYTYSNETRGGAVFSTPSAKSKMY